MVDNPAVKQLRIEIVRSRSRDWRGFASPDSAPATDASGVRVGV